MRLSPLDIKKQEFTRTLRGYDQDEVQAFLDMLAGQWEALLAEQRRTEEKVRELKAKMEHYEKVEEALQETLLTARESSQQALENARQIEIAPGARQRPYAEHSPPLPLKWRSTKDQPEKARNSQ